MSFTVDDRADLVRVKADVQWIRELLKKDGSRLDVLEMTIEQTAVDVAVLKARWRAVGYGIAILCTVAGVIIGLIKVLNQS